MNKPNPSKFQRLHRRRGPFRQEGATMVEFAIVSPFALLLVLGIIQLGLMFSAKEVVNEAAFLAARAGAVSNARVDDVMRPVMTRALIPFYQDTTITNSDLARLTDALGKSKLDTEVCVPVVHCYLKVEVLNPTPAAFQDFGLVSKASQNHTYIPNDNLEYRRHDKIGAASGLSIQDANALKIKVTYGYEIKVPLMQFVIKSVMCAFDTGVDAFGRGDSPDTGGSDCAEFYNQGRIPIVAYATVQMQTPAWQN
jgi:TadE-like protein